MIHTKSPISAHHSHLCPPLSPAARLRHQKAQSSQQALEKRDAVLSDSSFPRASADGPRQGLVIQALRQTEGWNRRRIGNSSRRPASMSMLKISLANGP